MCDPHCDLPEFYSVVARKARKQHKCSACSETISPGHTYTLISGKWNGEVESVKHCGRCNAIFDGLAAETNDPIDLLLDCGLELEPGDRPDLEPLAFALQGET